MGGCRSVEQCHVKMPARGGIQAIRGAGLPVREPVHLLRTGRLAPWALLTAPEMVSIALGEWN